MILEVDDKFIELDNEGYLVHLVDWSPAVAEVLAAREQLPLTALHWQVIELLRQFYQQFQLSPSNRPLVKYLVAQLGADVMTSLQLNLLFKGSPAKLAAKLAGLPRPTNCL